MARAARVKLEIESAINLGTFNLAEYARYFPDSPYLRAQGFNAQTDGDSFEQVAELWLKLTAADRQETTNREYRNALKCHFFPPFAARPIRAITYEQILAHLAETAFKSPKTFNNVMTPARQLFAWCVTTKRLDADPTAPIRFREVQAPQPDPFALDEIDAIVGHILKTYGDPWANYFEFAFFAGCRPSEQIALAWQKVDFRRGEVRVDSARVRTIDKGTKTHEARDVELAARALAALTRQKAHSFLSGGAVFLNPATGEAFADTSAPQEKVFQPTLRKLGIRPRDARNTRHSFATLGLMAGVNPAYMAGQMGHSLEMFFKVYAKWIRSADNSRELGKLDAFSALMPQSRHSINEK